MKFCIVALFACACSAAPLSPEEKPAALQTSTPAALTSLTALRDHAHVAQLLDMGKQSAYKMSPYGKDNFTDTDGILIRGGKLASWLPLNFVKFNSSREEIPLNMTNLVAALTDGLKYVKKRLFLSLDEFDIGCVARADGSIPMTCKVGEKMSLYSDFPPMGFAGLSAATGDALHANLSKLPPEVETYENCIVVGNSGNLQRKKQGGKIDGYQAVFRVDDAPTQPAEIYSQDVGSKTTFRFVNYLANVSVPAITADTTAKGMSGNVLVCQTAACFDQGMTKAFENGFNVLHPYWHKVTMLHPLEGKARLPSMGLVAIIAASQMCKTTSYIGFAPGPVDEATGKPCETYFDCTGKKLRMGPERDAETTVFNPPDSDFNPEAEAQLLAVLPENLKFKFENLDATLP